MILLPFISGIFLSLSGLFLRSSLPQITSLRISDYLFNKAFMVGILLTLIGGILMILSYKYLPLWMTVLIVNVTTIIGSALLSALILKEFMSPLRMGLIIIIILSLVGILVVK